MSPKVTILDSNQVINAFQVNQINLWTKIHPKTRLLFGKKGTISRYLKHLKHSNGIQTSINQVLFASFIFIVSSFKLFVALKSTDWFFWQNCYTVEPKKIIFKYIFLLKKKNLKTCEFASLFVTCVCIFNLYCFLKVTFFFLFFSVAFVMFAI